METLELFIRLKKEDLETLLTKHGDESTLKFFISRAVDKAVQKECEVIQNEKNNAYISDKKCTHCGGTGVDPLHRFQCIFCLNTMATNKYRTINL